MEHVQCIFIT